MRSEDLISVVRTCLTHSKHGIALTRIIPPFLQRCPGGSVVSGKLFIYQLMLYLLRKRWLCTRRGEGL